MSSEPEPPTTTDERLAMLAALVNGDVSLAYRLATELLAHGMPFDDIVVDILGPVQTEVGRRWAAGDLGVAYEHAASAAVEELLVRLGATAEASLGPTVVVASAQGDAHALGSRVVASALALDGFRVLFLGPSVPADDLGDFLELHQPLALALSCSISTALVGAARSVAAAHDAGIPVVGGGRVLAVGDRAARLGVDALAQSPRDAQEVLRAWELSPPDHLATAPAPIPEHALLSHRRNALVATALDAATNGDGGELDLADELQRVLGVVEGSLLIDDPDLLRGHVRWLQETGPAHGFARPMVDAALVALAEGMTLDLGRAGETLRVALR
jgi:methanogenic corrinoid protein MtbC1